MSNYECNKCGKTFKQKSHYTAHQNKKKPCVVESKIKEMIDNAVKEKLLEINSLHNSNISSISENILVNNVDENVNILKPILKWVGGKTQILDKLIVEFPKEINHYHEVFLGGGSMLIALLSYVKEGVIKVHGNIYAYDINEPLIYMYKNIQSYHTELYDNIQIFIKEYNECKECNKTEVNRKPKNLLEAKQSKENYYYLIRSKYNNLSSEEKTTIVGSSMFIFLNKTCFRGVFRVGPNGFNVPYGHYNNPEIINKEHLEQIHHLIQGVIFECLDFSQSLKPVEKDDYVYLDPPYAPETTTSFVGYTENGFGMEMHKTLFSILHELTKKNTKFMMSNADVQLVRENFDNNKNNNENNENKYKITSILCKRSIHSKSPDAKAMEVIIKNY